MATYTAISLFSTYFSNFILHVHNVIKVLDSRKISLQDLCENYEFPNSFIICHGDKKSDGNLISKFKSGL